MNITPEELAAITEREKAATEGPWISYTSWQQPDAFTSPEGFLADHNPDTIAEWQIIGGYPNDPPEGWRVVGGCVEEGTIQPTNEDIDFIKHARTDIPKLLAAYREMERELSDAKGELKSAEDAADWLEVKFNKVVDDRDEMRKSLESVNELARAYGYGQGELDEDLAGCLRKLLNQLTEAKAEVERLRAKSPRPTCDSCGEMLKMFTSDLDWCPKCHRKYQPKDFL